MDKRRNIKIVFFSDSHLGFDYKVGKTNKSTRGEDFFTNFNKVLDRAKEIKADLIIHGGDIFDKSNVSQKVIDRCYDALYNTADFGIPIILIPGNHDPSPLPSSLFMNHPNLHFQNETLSITLKLNGKVFNIHSVPFIRNAGEEIYKEFEMLDNNTCTSDFNILLLHQSIEGAKVGPVNFTFRKNKNTLAKKQIQNYYDLVLSGHVHKHQLLKMKNDRNTKILYCGSIERTSFNEINDVKGFVILEFSKKRDFKTPKIIFEKLKVRHMYDVLIENDYTNDKTLIEQLKNKVSSLDPNSIFRIDSNDNKVKANLSPDIIKKSFDERSIIEIKGLSKILKNKWK